MSLSNWTDHFGWTLIEHMYWQITRKIESRRRNSLENYAGSNILLFRWDYQRTRLLVLNRFCVLQKKFYEPASPQYPSLVSVLRLNHVPLGERGNVAPKIDREGNVPSISSLMVHSYRTDHKSWNTRNNTIQLIRAWNITSKCVLIEKKLPVMIGVIFNFIFCLVAKHGRSSSFSTWYSTLWHRNFFELFKILKIYVVLIAAIVSRIADYVSYSI